MLPLIRKKLTATYKIKVKSANYKLERTASKLFETITKPSLKNSGYKNTDKQTQSSMLAYNRRKDRQGPLLTQETNSHSFK